MKATMFLGALFVVAAGCSVSVDENGSCGDGQLGEECAASSECASGLVCRAEVCVDDGSHSTAESHGEPDCAEITDDASCGARDACEPVYAGVDCSCGSGCECQPSEPGCVCASFEFVACRTQAP